MPAHFTPASLKFLRGLTRHNDRLWFEPRKHIYEAELKAPMLALIDEINHSMETFAPDHIRPAAKCMMRIYRDVRFSNDKRPYKRQVAAWWSRHGLEKTSGGGFYFHLSSTELRVAAGCYMPEKEQLLSIRRMLVERHADYRALLAGRKLQALMQPIDALSLTRAPKGFPTEGPALDLVMQRQWGVESTLPIALATGPALGREIIRRFRVAAPLIAFLNEPLLTRPSSSKKPLF